MNAALQRMADDHERSANAIIAGFRSINMDAAKQEIPLFSGEIGGESIHDWLEKAERVAVNNGWTDAEKLRLFQQRLIKPASSFNDSIPADNKATLALWRQHFSAGFDDALATSTLKNKLDSLEQAPTERVRDYVAKINTTYRQAYGAATADDANANVVTLRDERKRAVFLQGLNRSIYNLMWFRLPPTATWTEVVDHAGQAETLLGKKKVSEDGPVLDEAVAKLLRQNSNLIKQASALTQDLQQAQQQSN